MSISSMYRHCQHSRSQVVASRKPHGGNVTEMPGRQLRCHSTEPPPAADYQTWLETQLHAGPRGQHGKTNLTGERLRRAVYMRRNGYSWVEVQAALSNANIRKTCSYLPPELAP